MNTELSEQIRLLKSCAACVTAVALLGCAAPPAKYYPEAEQAIEDEVGTTAPSGDAIVEFTTNSAAIAVFQQRVGDKLCEPDSQHRAASVRRREIPSEFQQSFRGLAHFLSLGALAELEKMPKTKITHYPANQPLAFAATTHITNGTCGPLFLQFTPQAAKRYSLSMDFNGQSCRLDIRELDGSAQLHPVKHSRWRCAKGLFGIGKPTLIGPDEIN